MNNPRLHEHAELQNKVKQKKQISDDSGYYDNNTFCEIEENSANEIISLSKGSVSKNRSTVNSKLEEEAYLNSLNSAELDLYIEELLAKELDETALTIKNEKELKAFNKEDPNLPVEKLLIKEEINELNNVHSFFNKKEPVDSLPYKEPVSSKRKDEVEINSNREELFDDVELELFIEELLSNETININTQNEKQGSKTPDIVLAEKGKWHKLQTKKRLHTARQVIYSLVVIFSITVLITTLWVSILRVYGSSMEPSLYYDDILLVTKGSKYEQGDIIAFYYNNKILLKRAIAMPGDVVNIDKNGNVYVNNSRLKEPYKEGKNMENSDIDYPFTVPEKQVFVLGDQRDISADSRSSAIGTIPEELIIGKVGFRIWPLNKLGAVG